MNRRGGIKATLLLGIAASCLCGFMFHRQSGVFREFEVALLSVQWMLPVCLAIWCGSFLFLSFGLNDLPLIGLLLIALAAYFIAYSVWPITDAITLLAGATLGKGAGLLLKAESGMQDPPSLRSSAARAEIGNESGADERVALRPWLSHRMGEGGYFLVGLALLLAFASLWHVDMSGNLYPRLRRMGLWNNPNDYGMLMGTGLVLAIGLLSGRQKAEGRGQKPANGKWNPLLRSLHSLAAKSVSSAVPTTTCGARAVAIILFIAAGMTGVGLLFSYSRGAWVGTAIGLLYLAKAYGRFKWRWVVPGIVIVAGVVWFFWNATLDTAPWYMKRLDLSRASAQHRVAAWGAGFEIMRDHPFGVGWNKAVETYEKNYLPPEGGGLAITTNDYLMLGTQLGWPGLICFVAYVALCFRTNRPQPNLVGTLRCDVSACETAGGTLVPLDAARTAQRAVPTSQLRAACRAGALAMLVAFWFDDGLFKLATASVFWILLELGTSSETGFDTSEMGMCGSAAAEKSLTARQHGPRRSAGHSHWFRCFAINFCVPMLLLVGIIVIILCARGGDPFKRIEFSLNTANSGAVRGLVVLPKPTGIHPVVVYLQGAGESPLRGENELRQIAELGLAAVSLQYDPTNQNMFDEQFIALHHYLQMQSWAKSNATATVAFGLGAQRTLAFAARHPKCEPQLLACLNAGCDKQLESDKSPTPNSQHPVLNILQPSTSMHCQALLINGEMDNVSAVADVERLTGWLRSQGVPVETHTVPKSLRDFGEDRDVVVRATAEYCAARLPAPDYTFCLKGCQLTVAERERFNQAMQRAGQRRRELWHAVTEAREPERDTMMNVIGGLEDYDLAHMTAAQLRKFVYNAWRARRKYPWCRDTPQEIFERFVANPRIYQEPLVDWSEPYGPTLASVEKYCHTTAEASDALWNWMRVRVYEHTSSCWEQPERILSRIRGNCDEFVVAFTGLARTVGLPVRPAWTFWPTIGNEHYWNEVWSVEERQWHAFDTSALNRPYDADWMNRVPKSVIQVPTGERGAWHAVADQRWEFLTNSIGLFYPSGKVLIRVLDDGQAAPRQRVGVQIWLGNGMGGHGPNGEHGLNARIFWEPEVFTIAAAITDQKGEARLVLGQSAEQPYRIFLDTGGESDWQWLAVQSNGIYTVTLDTAKTRPFDIKATPPALPWLKAE